MLESDPDLDDRRRPDFFTRCSGDFDTQATLDVAATATGVDSQSRARADDDDPDKLLDDRRKQSRGKREDVASQSGLQLALAPTAFSF